MKNNFKVTAQYSKTKGSKILSQDTYWVLSNEEVENEMLSLLICNFYKSLGFILIGYKYELIDCFVTTDYIKQEMETISQPDELEIIIFDMVEDCKKKRTGK